MILTIYNLLSLPTCVVATTVCPLSTRSGALGDKTQVLGLGPASLLIISGPYQHGNAALVLRPPYLGREPHRVSPSVRFRGNISPTSPSKSSGSV